MDLKGGVESYLSIAITAEITLDELRNGGGELFAAHLRERLEDELKLILDAPWSKVEKVAPPQPPAQQIRGAAVAVHLSD